MRIVSYYTPAYEPVSIGLQRDILAFGLDAHIMPMPDRGSWRLNCGAKAGFIRDRLEHGEPVLWLDADARIRGPLPEPEDCDFAAWFIPSARMARSDQVHEGADGIAAGTMYFAPTDAGKEFVRRWCEAEQGQGKYEQVVLTEVWYNRAPEGLRTRRLDQGWCKVFDAPWFDGPEILRVEHMQASRRLRYAR